MELPSSHDSGGSMMPSPQYPTGPSAATHGPSQLGIEETSSLPEASSLEAAMIDWPLSKFEADDPESVKPL
jgi:hypothetical protein